MLTGIGTFIAILASGVALLPSPIKLHTCVSYALIAVGTLGFVLLVIGDPVEIDR
jgi:hypothetical protein